MRCPTHIYSYLVTYLPPYQGIKSYLTYVSTPTLSYATMHAHRFHGAQIHTYILSYGTCVNLRSMSGAAFGEQRHLIALSRSYTSSVSHYYLNSHPSPSQDSWRVSMAGFVSGHRCELGCRQSGPCSPCTSLCSPPKITTRNKCSKKPEAWSSTLRSKVFQSGLL